MNCAGPDGPANTVGRAVYLSSLDIADFDRAASDLKKGQTVLVLVNRRGASLYLSAKI